MDGNTYTSRTLQFALAMFGFALAGGVAAAEPPVEVTAAEVTVEAARPTTTVERSYTGTPVELITLTRHVRFADLDLTTHAGAVELEKRVNDSANAACTKLDTLYPLTAKQSAGCTKKSADNAMVQVRAAIAAAEKAAAPK
jgi:UrcA family protein